MIVESILIRKEVAEKRRGERREERCKECKEYKECEKMKDEKV